MGAVPPGGEVAGGGESADVADVAEQAGGPGRTDAREARSAGAGLGEQVGELLVRDFDLLVQRGEFGDQFGGELTAGLVNQVPRPHRGEQLAGLRDG